MSKAKAFNLRSFTSFMVTVAFLVATVTGIVLFIVPQGRIANWVNWELVGLSKDAWGDIHLTFAVVFIIGGFLHLYPYNWKPFKNYLAERVSGRLDMKRPKKEFLAALGAAVVLIAGTVANVPPFTYLFDLNDMAKESWVSSPDLEPPFGHAEELSLAGFSRKMNIDLKGAMAELKAKGVKFDGAKSKLNEIAAANDTNAMNVYMLIKKFEKKPAPMAVTKASLTGEEVEAKFSGTGIGRKTLAQVSEQVGLSLEEVKARLAKAGIKADGQQKMKEIAEPADMTPVDLLKVILIGQPAVTKVSYSPESVEADFAGSGVGHKTLAQLCQTVGLPLDEAKKRLAKVGIDAKGDEIFKELGSKRDIGPMDVLKIVLVDGFKI